MYIRTTQYALRYVAREVSAKMIRVNIPPYGTGTVLKMKPEVCFSIVQYRTVRYDTVHVLYSTLLCRYFIIP